MNHPTLLVQAKEPWIVFRALQDLFGKSIDDPDVIRARHAMEDDPQLIRLREEIRLWPGHVLNSHKSAGQLYHKMVFLADLGFDESDPSIAQALGTMRAGRNEKGLYTLPTTIAPAYGGTGLPISGWALCDAPVLLYAMAKMGNNGLAEARQGAEFVAGLAQPFGFPCVVCDALGKWRGPGKKTDPCPYATLVSLKLLGMYEDLKDSPAAMAAGEALLQMWVRSREWHPYMFSMGTDFRKLKAPFIWYDIVHLAEVLSQWDWIRKDPRFLDIMTVIRNKVGINGLYTPESEWNAWSEWEFGQKKVPSLWLSLIIARIEAR